MRRQILKLFPAASALPAFRGKGETVANPAFTSAGFSICVHCWTFKDFTWFEAVEMAAATGAGGVGLYPGQKLGGSHGKATLGPNMTHDALQSAIDHLEKHHLAAINFGVIAIPNDEREARRIFEFARKLNLYGITTESLGSLDLLEKLAAEYNIKICFHNHPKPTALWHPDTIWKALEDRHPNVGFCADIGHWASSNLDPLEVIRKIAPRAHAFHLKDRASIQEPSRDQPFGTGVIDIAAILDEVRAHGFAGNVSIEYETNWKTSLPEVAQCAGYLRAHARLRT